MPSRLKPSPLYHGLRTIKWKYINYFADQGLINKRCRQFLSQFDPLIRFKERKKVYQYFKNHAQPLVVEIANQLEKKGYAFVSMNDLQVPTEAAFDYCKQVIDRFQQQLHSAEFLKNMPQAQYAGRTISYQLYEHQKRQEATRQYDPLLAFALHETIIAIATLYLGHLPILEDISLDYNPVHDGNQFGSQLWHRDTQHKRMLKLFFSTKEITEENGPFEFFPPALSGPRFYKYLPQGMSDSQIAETGLDPKCAIKFLAQPGDFLFADVTRCMHRGGFTKTKPRYVNIISYSSPLYSFTRKHYRETETFRFSFKDFRAENERLVDQYLAKV